MTQSQPLVNLRKTKRHTINVEAHLLCAQQSYAAKVLDISEGGAKLYIEDNSLQPGESVCIDLPFLNELHASIIWAKGHKCGLRFKDEQNCLNEFLYNLAIYGADDLHT